MKSAIFVCLLSLAAVTLARPEEPKYTDKYDNINVPEILGNDRLLNPYVDCLLEKGRCTPEGKELKSHVTDAMQTGCAKCTPAQRKGTEDVIRHLINNKQAAWEELKAKYDPNGAYAKKYEDDLKALKQ